jgi:hypothetical protein
MTPSLFLISEMRLWYFQSRESIKKIKYNLFQNQKSTNSASASKIQPTTSPTFVFSVSTSARKKWGYERKLLDSRFGRSSSCFYFHFIISFKKYDMVAKTFLYIIIILCFVNKLNSSMSNFGARLSQPKKIKLFLGISFFLPT